MNQEFRAIGFDLGDTLIFYRDVPMNWLAHYPKALRSVADACDAKPTPAQFAGAEKILSQYNTRIVLRTKEVRAEQIFSEILAAWNLDPSIQLAAAVEAFFTFFQQQMCAYPETISVLTSLRQGGFLTGILTDVPYGMPREFVQRDLDGAGISGLFDVVLSSVEVGVRKPEPAGYLALASRIGVEPREMLYVGNEPKDVIGACRAGLTAVFLDRANSGARHGQHHTTSTLMGLLDIATAGKLS